jgi:hypothetical protein
MSCRNAEGVNELLWLAGVRHLPHREELRLGWGNARLRESGEHRLAYSSFRLVIFHGDEPTACGGNFLAELFSVDGFDAIKVDHPHDCALFLQLISGLERLV